MILLNVSFIMEQNYVTMKKASMSTFQLMMKIIKIMKNDNGYYGKGIYATDNPFYAKFQIINHNSFISKISKVNVYAKNNIKDALEIIKIKKKF